jgi:hypothetical protein
VIPLNIILCLVLCGLFLLIKKYKVSQNIRKFYFVKTVLLQSLFEGNVIYLVYVCFGHLQSSFSFHFGDKLSLAFTVLFLWVTVVFTFCFYQMVGYFLGKRACYFIYCYYRCDYSYHYLTLKNLVRNFLRGSIFYFLRDYLAEEFILLSVVEVGLVLCSIALQSYKKIFISKTFYSLWLIYHSLFILLNFSLYFGFLADNFYYDPGLK